MHNLAQISCSCHKLTANTSHNTSKARHEKTCCFCNSAVATQDEQHILLHCPQLDDLRSTHGHQS